MACLVSLDWKIEYILSSWNILSAWADAHHTWHLVCLKWCHELSGNSRNGLKSTLLAELPDSHLRFFEQQHRSSCGKSNSIRRMCISVNKLNRQQNWYFLWFCYCLAAGHPQQLLLNCSQLSLSIVFFYLIFYRSCFLPTLFVPCSLYLMLRLF